MTITELPRMYAKFFATWKVPVAPVIPGDPIDPGVFTETG